MQKLVSISKRPKHSIWEKMWSTRKIEQELEATQIETAPKAMFLSYIPKNGKVIDAGCGFGKWVILLNRLGYDIVGVDNSDLAINQLRNYDKNLKVEMGDILALNYPDNHFDAYISMGVVEHFEEGPIPALKEAYRVLKPNGIIFLSTPTVNIIRKILIGPFLYFVYKFPHIVDVLDFFRRILIENKFYIKKKSKSKFSRRRYHHFLEYRFSIFELENFLKKTNFEVIKTVPHDFPGSKDHAIGLGVDFPFLRERKGVNFKLNVLGKLISRLLNAISPWIACASVLCVAKVLKNEKNE